VTQEYWVSGKVSLNNWVHAMMTNKGGSYHFPPFFQKLNGVWKCLILSLHWFILELMNVPIGMDFV